MGGTRFGEDFTEQATEPELKKLWNKWVKIDKEKQRRWDVENVSVRADLKLWANQERKRAKLETLQSWQAAKNAKLSGDAVTTTTKHESGELAAVDEAEEEDSYIEEMDEEEEYRAGEEAAMLDCGSVEQAAASQGGCPASGCLILECGECTLPRSVWDADDCEYIYLVKAEEPLPDTTSTEERDDISVKAVDAATTIFKKNGGFDRDRRGTKDEQSEEMISSEDMESLQRMTGDDTVGDMKRHTDCVDATREESGGLSASEEQRKEECKREHRELTAMECKVRAAQLLKDEERSRKARKLQALMNSAREEQATGGKGKGGKGKGGNGKGGGGKGAGSLPHFVKADYHSPLPPLSEKEHDDSERMRVESSRPREREALGDGVHYAGPDTPSADTLDLGDEEFPALGMSLRDKRANEEVKRVSGSSGQVAATRRFMRQTYGISGPPLH